MSIINYFLQQQPELHWQVRCCGYDGKFRNYYLPTLREALDFVEDDRENKRKTWQKSFMVITARTA